LIGAKIFATQLHLGGQGGSVHQYPPEYLNSYKPRQGPFYLGPRLIHRPCPKRPTTAGSKGLSTQNSTRSACQ